MANRNCSICVSRFNPLLLPVDFRQVESGRTFYATPCKCRLRDAALPYLRVQFPSNIGRRIWATTCLLLGHIICKMHFWPAISQTLHLAKLTNCKRQNVLCPKSGPVLALQLAVDVWGVALTDFVLTPNNVPVRKKAVFFTALFASDFDYYLRFDNWPFTLSIV